MSPEERFEIMQWYQRMPVGTVVPEPGPVSEEAAEAGEPEPAIESRDHPPGP